MNLQKCYEEIRHTKRLRKNEIFKKSYTKNLRKRCDRLRATIIRNSDFENQHPKFVRRKLKKS